MDTARDPVTVDLGAVIIAVSDDAPRVLTLDGGCGRPALPSGVLRPEHRTLEAGLRAWVEAQTGQRLGYVEQLYTFGDRGRSGGDPHAPRALSIGYLALVRAVQPAGDDAAGWRDWYRFFPWEDWRDGRPRAIDRIADAMADWISDSADAAEGERRAERARLAFGVPGGDWNDERVLERYELLYELGLVPEPHRDRAATWADAAAAGAGGESMTADHRRILATAIARMRGKLKYRPVVFELLPPVFTFLQLQRTVEALAGLRLHKPNFRRLVERQGLVEETGAATAETGGRPARLLRFRREVLVERPAPGMGLPRTRRGG